MLIVKGNRSHNTAAFTTPYNFCQKKCCHSSYGNGRFGHPEQDRALSLREGAILQSFPLDYKFSEDSEQFSSKKLAMQIGNAVPPKLGEVIGISIKNHLGLE